MNDKLKIDIVVYDNQCYVEFNLYKEVHTIPIEDIGLILKGLTRHIEESNTRVMVYALTCRGGAYRSLQMDIIEAIILREELVNIFGEVDD